MIAYLFRLYYRRASNRALAAAHAYATQPAGRGWNIEMQGALNAEAMRLVAFYRRER